MGYKFRIPTTCVALILLALNFFYIVLQLYVIKSGYYQGYKGTISLFAAYFTYFLSCTVEFALALMLLRSTKLGSDLSKCHTWAKWWRNIDIVFFIVNSALYVLTLGGVEDKVSLDYQELVEAVVDTVLHSLSIVIVWLYVCELGRAMDEGQVTLEEIVYTYSQELQSEIVEVDGVCTIEKKDLTSGNGSPV